MRFDDSKYRKRFYPLSRLKGIEDLRVGIFTFGERLRKLFGETEFIFTPNFVPFEGLRENAPVILVNGKVVGFNPREVKVWEEAEEFARMGRASEIRGIFFENFWELPLKVEAVLENDLKIINLEGYYKIGEIYIHRTAKVSLKGEFEGWGLIDEGAVIKPFVVLEGGVYVGKGSLVKPFSYIVSSVIGPVCKVAGEISHTVFEGFSNKQHGGFVGHSYISSWVNIGAGTEVSNLKNTYGPVKVYSYEKQGLVDTGEPFLGMFAGDHVKIGINTTISTGTVLGIFANITAKDSPTEKFIPDFYWTGGGKMSLEKAIEMVRRVMGRRGVKPDEGYIDKIRESYG
jgi:N-acetylglucosamine-1-phosphate uridyltransferase (contains nucleotidyltransferase and I-patch acetyltransferase domains)